MWTHICRTAGSCAWRMASGGSLPPSTSIRSPTRSADQRPGCPNGVDRSPTCGCSWAPPPLPPAFDINPFPDKERESKTWLSERDGPITDVRMLLARASYFALDEQQALVVLGEVHAGVSNWRQVALGAEVGLPAAELDDFELAFEHEQMD